MKVNKNFIHREIAGEHILVPVGNENLTHNGLFTITDVAARIWELLPECDTQEQIVDAVLSEYDIDRDTAKEDVKEFLDKLREFGMLE